MNEKKSMTAAPKTVSSDHFMESLRKTLEHIHAPDWLAQNSPLASVFFAGTTRSGARQRHVTLSGQSEVDERLRTIWHEWEELLKTPLQSLLWETVCQLPTDSEMPLQATLILSYFDIEQPKQSQVIKLLAIGRSTYYRYLEKAIAQVGDRITNFMRPALQLEMPLSRPLVGREREQTQALTHLNAGEVVHLVGGSGLGKTALGAHLAEKWNHGVFWYTFRSGITDYFEQFLYVVAYFLHQQGESGLWLYLTASTAPIDPGRALLALRQHLSNLRDRPPLFCFDEVDLLLADELHDSEEHAMLRSLLEEWSQSERMGSSMLLIGQKVLVEPADGTLIHLAAFTVADLSSLTNTAGRALTEEQCIRLITLTRGNPLLLSLFLTLYQRSKSVVETLDALTTPMNLDWFLTRLTKHLTTKEQVILYELSVFTNHAPKDVWLRTKKQLETLITLGLADESNHGVTLHPAIRDLLYARLSHDRKAELHLAAGQMLAERGRFTAAARQYVAAEHPDLAIWTWYTHQAEELEQGQAKAALDLFGAIERTSLPRVADQQALALLLAPLLARTGRARTALTQMEQVHWPDHSVSGALASEVRGELFAEMGDLDRSLAESRKSLQLISQLRSTHEAEIRLQIARRSFAYLRDIEQSSQELQQVDLTLRTLKGNLARTKGDYAAARILYTEALAIADECNDRHQLARLYANLGILDAQQGNLEAAIEHYKNAQQHFHYVGNLVSAAGTTNSGLAFAYLNQHKYAEAVAPAEEALSFFQKLGHAYWRAINETYLAEAWLYLDDLEKAEAYAQSALSQEEIAVRPYCLFLLGHVRRRQKHFTAAEHYCLDAIEVAEEFQDPLALAPAWSALGETLRDSAQNVDAIAAFQKSLDYWQQGGNQIEVDHTLALLQEMDEMKST